MKNSRKIVVGSALILALSFSTIANSISYAEEDPLKNVETNEVETNEENNENLIEAPNEELKEDVTVENTEEDEETEDIDQKNESTEPKSEESNGKVYTESDYDENYSRIDEYRYKYRDQFNDDKIIFEEESYNEAKAYEKSEEYQKNNPYNKIQNIKEIEENKRVEKFDENLDIGFGDGVIAKNSSGLLNDFIKFNYKNEQDHLDDVNNKRHFSISFDDENFDPSKVGDYEIKARVMSYYSNDSINATASIGDIVENFIRIRVVNDGNDRIMYNSVEEAKDAAKEAINSSSDFNNYTIFKDGNKYSYSLSYYDRNEDYKKPKEELDKDYESYQNYIKSGKEFQNTFKEDMHKYDEESQKYIKSYNYNSGQITEPLSREEFEEKYPSGNPFGEGIIAQKNFAYAIMNKLNLLPQYDYKNESLNEKVSIEDFAEINIYNADLQVGNKLPHLKKLVEFNFLKEGPRVNYSWDPDSIDTNKLGKQNLDVKFTYWNAQGQEEELTKTIVINIVDSSKQDPDTEEVLDKKGLEKEISEETNINPNEFTEESYQNYKALLASAKDLLNKKDVKQEEIDKALEELKESRKNLVKVDIGKEDEDNKNNDNKKENSNFDFPIFATESEARKAAEEYLVDSKDFDSYTIKKTDDGKYYYELSRKDKKISDNKVANKTSKEEDQTKSKEKEIKPVKVSEIKKSSNVKTGVTGLSGLVGVFVAAVGGYFFTKKNK